MPTSLRDSLDARRRFAAHSEGRCESIIVRPQRRLRRTPGVASVTQPLDYEGVRRLIAIYGQLLDSKRLAEWGELFVNDATFRVWGQTYRGRIAIVREIGGMQPATPVKHGVLSPVIDFEGPERCRAWTDLVTFAATPEGIRVSTIGRYHDRIARDGGRWRFLERAVVMAGEALPADVAASPAY
jgi:3-phenylpropionate/cinnamic acid dioxygenase small subunit